MTEHDHDELRRLFDVLVETEPSGRDEVLDRECTESPGMRQRVVAMLAALEDEGPFLAQATADLDGPEITIVNGRGERPGETIGRYKLLQPIGEGGFGNVWMAEQREPVARRVALKIIKLGMDTKQVIARFEAERQALAIMDHPNIAKVFDAGATDAGRPYFVMELVRGAPITDYCDRHKLAIRDRLELIAQVCEALQHAHQRGVIHRDIKPNNVLVSTLGDRPVPKVIDFGIAKATTARLTEKTLFTEHRQMIGTPEYMSPEQAGEGGEDIDTRTDVYSTGVLLYELITGSTPFDGTSLRSAAFGELQRIIREVDPPKPSTRVSQQQDDLDSVAAHRRAEPRKLGVMIRGELDWIVMKALDKERDRRYESSGAMAQDIRRYLDGDAVHAAPPSSVYVMRKFARRYRGPVLTVMLIVIVLIAGLVGTSLGFVNASAQREVAVEQRDLATTEKERADARTQDAIAAEATATRIAYTASMLSACAALEASHEEKAAWFLEDAPERLRGWEWDVVDARLDISSRTMPAPTPTGAAVGHRSVVIPHPDGKSILTVSGLEAEAAQLRDIATGEVLGRFEHPAGNARTAESNAWFTFAPDGSRLNAVANAGGHSPLAIVVWDLESGARVFQTTVVPAEALTGPAALAPDGTRLLLTKGPSAWLRDLETGATVAATELPFAVASRGFSDDGSLLAVADGRGKLAVLDGRTLELLQPLEGHRNMVESIEFSRDGQWLVTGARDDSARVWNLHAQPSTSVALPHPQALFVARLSPDSATVATTCGDGAVRVWDALSGALEATYTGDALVGNTLAFMRDVETIAARHQDGTIRFWNIEAETTVNLEGHRGILTGAAFAEAPGLIVSTGWDGWSGSPGCIRIWDAETGDQVAVRGSPGEIARFLTVSGEGRRAAATVSPRHVPGLADDPDRTARVEIIDLVTGSVARLEPAWDLAFAPAGERLALGKDGRLEIRDGSGELLLEREDGLRGKRVGSMRWSGDGRLLACAMTVLGGPSKDLAEFEVLDAASLETVYRSATGPIVFAPGERALVGSPSGILHIVRTDTWEQVGTVEEFQLGRGSLEVSPDGTRLATRDGGRGVITVWSLETFDRVAMFEDLGFTASVAWNADGTRLVGACGRTVKVWDATPVGKRAQQRQVSRAAIEIVRPLMDRLVAEQLDTRQLLARIAAQTALSELQRRAARQQVLRRGLADAR